MIHQLKSYFKFLWNSKNEHGVHSPFVFHLVTKCFYDKKIYPEYSVLKDFRNSLLNNPAFIEVTDFGAGSKVFKSNKRQISRIAKLENLSWDVFFRSCDFTEKGATIFDSLLMALCSENDQIISSDNIYEKFGFRVIDLKKK